MATVEKRGDSWCLIAYLGYEPSGKQIKKKKSIPAEGITKIEAKRLANAYENELLKKKFINDKNMTLSEFVDYWKQEFALQGDNYSPTTLERNETLLARILPALGHIRIAKLKPTHLMEFYNNLREDDMRLDGKEGKLSSRTVQMHHKLISSILGKAQKWQMLEMNPCMYVDAPKSKSKKTPIWNEETLIRFLELLYQHAKTKYLLFFLLAFSTGLRRGELLGLRKTEDINLEKAELRVNQNAIVVKKLGVQHKDPKTEKSASGVSFSPSIIPVFQQHFVEQDLLRKRFEENGGVWPDNDLVFTTSEGKSMFPSTISHWLADFIEEHNLPKISTRSFRNMSITYAIDRGFDLKAVSERARHAQLSTTTDVYAHVLKPKDKAIAASLDKIIQSAMPDDPDTKIDYICDDCGWSGAELEHLSLDGILKEWVCPKCKSTLIKPLDPEKHINFKIGEYVECDHPGGYIFQGTIRKFYINPFNRRTIYPLIINPNTKEKYRPKDCTGLRKITKTNKNI